MNTENSLQSEPPGSLHPAGSGCGGKTAIEPSKQLKACPFCGAPACLHRRRSVNNAVGHAKTGWVYHVHCTDCGAHFHEDGNEPSAISRWNRLEQPNDDPSSATASQTRSIANSDVTEPFSEARGWTAGEVIERAKSAVTEHCRAEVKPAGRSAMYRDCIYACLDQLRAHMEKPSND